MIFKTRKRDKVHIEIIVHRPIDEGEKTVKEIKNALRRAKRKNKFSYLLIDVTNTINQ
jgi:hypothetical protein